MSILRFVQNIRRLNENWKAEGTTEIIYRWYRNAGQIKTGNQIGEDQFGNRYFEDHSDNINSLTGRDRWVEYSKFTTRNASQVPPEWHSWLHFTGDAPLARTTSKYIANHQENKTGTSASYAPHNFMMNKNFDPEQAKNSRVKQATDRHSLRAKSMGFNVDDL